jgi:copper resistance protein C
MPNPSGRSAGSSKRIDLMKSTKMNFRGRVFSGLAVLCFGMAALAGLPAQAFAHAHLKASTPADQATVSPGPQMLRLEFSEGVEPKFCTVAVTMGDGMDMGPTTLATDPQDPKILIATLPGKLAAGTYKVVWHAVATDTHKTDGSYGFTVE